MENKMKLIKFECDNNLSKYTDSMLFDSDTVIATMVCEYNECTTTIGLMVRGAVDIYYNGNRYNSTSEFPVALRKLIEKDPEWFDNENVEVVENNWFEYIYDVYGDGISYSDGIMFEDKLDTYNEDTLKKDMLEVFEYIALNGC